ncbi:MAG: aminotransferase class V-fold PLP-dependent enzyme [Chlorobi bacterium]|nr:aminotransferase class V-fold PLP-dependent enzyme [Chlorobiota bacterium]
MIKYSLKDDYSEGAHPKIIEKLLQTNLQQENGYGNDIFSDKAKQEIKNKIGVSDAEIHFVTGGTQANLTVIASLLKPYESVIAAESAHIAMNETGAIEATGHKIHSVKAYDGKVKCKEIQEVLDVFNNEHHVKPKVVFISNTTEIGSLYSKKELTDLSNFCKKNNLLLYMDGARLGSALSSKYNDLSLPEIAKLVDVFYIGGTKNGALLGEAVVIVNDNLKANFRFHMKQRGALLPKGRLLGIQFLELFKEDLFFEIGRHENAMATKLAEGIKNLGFDFLTKPVSNQLFPILPNNLIKEISKKYDFHIWEKKTNEKSAIRLVCSWATKEYVIDEFLADIKNKL